MSFWQRLTTRLRHLIDAPLRNLGAGERALRYLYDLVLHCARQLRRDRADQLAAALTYRTLFSLLPMLALALVFLQSFLGQEAKNEFKNTVIEWIVTPLRPDAFDPDEQAASATLVEAPTEAGALTGREDFTNAQSALSERFEQITAALEAIDFTSVGIFGLLLFIYAATGLLNTLEQSFDQVYRARRRRPWLRRVPLYYSVVTLGPALLLAGLYLRGAIIFALEGESMTRWLASTLAFLSPMLSAWLLLVIMFVAVPNAKVTFRWAAIGAAVAATAVGVASELFRVYVANAGAASLYGALALLPLFLLWIYLVWLLILFGLEVSFALQTVRDRDWVEAENQAARPIEDFWALPLAVEVARAFDRGTIAQSQSLAEKLDLPVQAVRRLVGQLEDGGFVREIETSGQRGYTLARPAQHIGMSDLLDTVSPLPSFKDDDLSDVDLHRFLGTLHHAALEKARGRTLAEFVSSQTDAADAETEGVPEASVGAAG